MHHLNVPLNSGKNKKGASFDLVKFKVEIVSRGAMYIINSAHFGTSFFLVEGFF